MPSQPSEQLKSAPRETPGVGEDAEKRERKPGQPLRRTAWRVLKKFNMELPSGAALYWPVRSSRSHGRGQVVQEEVTRRFNTQTMSKSHEAEATPSFRGACHAPSPGVPCARPRLRSGPRLSTRPSLPPQTDSPRNKFI